MSATEPPQAQVRSHRNGNTAHNTKPRVPSSRYISKASVDLGREIVPEDSVSNAPSVAPSRTTGPSRPRINGLHRDSYEKRTEKTRTTITTQRIRTVSPGRSVVANTSEPLTNGVAPADTESNQQKKTARTLVAIRSS